MSRTTVSAARAARFALLLGVGVGALGLGPAFAQEPSPAALGAAKEIIEAKGTSRMFEPAVPGVIETAKNSLTQLNPGLAKDLSEVAAQLRTEFAGKREEISAELSRSYAQAFTDEELKQVVAFYKSAVGQKVIAQEPQIMEQTMTRLSAWADRFADEVLSRFRAEMKKRGHNL